MLTAINDYLPRFHAYLRRKGEILGSRTGLPWWDLFAPLGENNKTYTIEESKEYLTSHFRPFSDDLADLTIEAFDNNWIDFLPVLAKLVLFVQIFLSKESRILTNFNGSLSDQYPAHELGHAYHGLHIQDHLPLNTDYSMPVAETASNFNEILIMNAAINEAKGNEN